jgi:hypothetical protein
MITEEIQALSNEELAFEIRQKESTPFEMLDEKYFMHFLELKYEAKRRSDLAASQREARGEQPLFPETCPRIPESEPYETNTDGLLG